MALLLGCSNVVKLLKCCLLPILLAGSFKTRYCMFKLGDLYPESEKEKDQEEPDWVKNEREHFNDFRDKNKDGKMDRVCIKNMFQVLF